jgi:hypothetical protein
MAGPHEPYVLQLIALYERQVAHFLTLQNPENVLPLGLVSTHLANLRQAYNRCDHEQQLYCVNRAARILGEIEGNEHAKEKLNGTVPAQDGGV